MLNNFLANYFGFNKQQRNGVLVLVCISLLLLMIRVAYPYFIEPDPVVLLDLPLIERKLDSAHASSQASKAQYYSKNKQAVTRFVFDPNTVSYEQLLQLGLREKTAKAYIKFREKGFVFKEKQDLKRVYGISEQLYAGLEPYILVGKAPVKQEAEVKQEPVAQQQPVQSKTVKVELNSADSVALVALPGIGTGYARRILKYRNVLGGFVQPDQLKEVYGFSEELYEKIKAQVYVEPAGIRKINLNKDDFKTINKHPYLSYELTKNIFDWRRKTVLTAGNLKDILNDNALWQKLLPYLSFE